jgi:cellulose synthase/poly-beta-1,6-N-acetylglucosamine synthase-like glycosyltransferase
LHHLYQHTNFLPRLWGLVEHRIFNYYLTAYRPIPIPSKPQYKARDVSIIVCTIDSLLSSCLLRWLENDPLEIIIVTTEEHLTTIQEIVRKVHHSQHQYKRVVILTSPEKGKRAQLRFGIQAARGRIIASVDDHITWHPEFLRYTLPCFEDASIGACGTPIKTTIPPSRRFSKIITPWEVAATRVSYKRNSVLKSMYSASRWCTVLAGGTCIYRAEIVQDAEFLHAYTNDYWRGKYKLDVGEDTLITRWLQKRNWTIAIQACDETEVERTVKRDGDFLKQMFRWERSTIQSHIRMVLGVPQIWRYVWFALVGMQ